MIVRKGIILAGGNGSRLHPITNVISKQLLPVYDKPMIYYPLSTLLLAGINDILIITSIQDRDLFYKLLGDGSTLGIKIKYEIQEKPEGIAQALLIGKKFIQKSDVALILGDNLFHGDFLIYQLQNSFKEKKGATVYAYPVSEPQRYGVVEFDSNGKAYKIEEKPKNPKSKFVITGLYFYDNTVVSKAESLVPSKRGELEITDLNNLYMQEGNLMVERMNRGMTWFDTGTLDSLHEASSYIRSLEKRQGLKIGCPEEIAWRMGLIDTKKLISISENMLNSGYGHYLLSIAKENKSYLKKI